MSNPTMIVHIIMDRTIIVALRLVMITMIIVILTMQMVCVW